jgi:type I restriction enzyme S subunit
VSVRAPVGDINTAIEDCCIGRGIAAVRHNGGANSFVYYSMESLKPRFAHYESEGTVFGAINKSNFQLLPVLSPSEQILAAFEKIVGPLDELVRINEEQSRTLTGLRDILLPRLLSGELSIESILNSSGAPVL